MSISNFWVSAIRCEWRKKKKGMRLLFTVTNLESVSEVFSIATLCFSWGFPIYYHKMNSAKNDQTCIISVIFFSSLKFDPWQNHSKMDFSTKSSLRFSHLNWPCIKNIPSTWKNKCFVGSHLTLSCYNNPQKEWFDSSVCLSVFCFFLVCFFDFPTLLK